MHGQKLTLKVDKDKKLPYCAQIFIYKNTLRICQIYNVGFGNKNAI